MCALPLSLGIEGADYVGKQTIRYRSTQLICGRFVDWERQKNGRKLMYIGIGGLILLIILLVILL
jgi:hypothetical protein